MCGKCDSVDEARCVFDRMTTRNAVTWCVLLGVYCQKENFDTVIELSRGMAEVNLYSFGMVLRVCADFAEDSALWGALPGACNTSTNSIVAERIGMKMMELDPDYYLSYVLLANAYREVGRDDAVDIRKLMEERGVKKKLPEKCWIDINNTR
ncbi:hypothetical protein RJ639_006947 [Escallonia herrerae]|uniref:Pentatricopeptide repeat-containing protein n=1 Tax=Escallonia herrerae TaxID=1293975 RepID=A0AA88VW45_9ASTE|nr:hypothetical protein RJ639_006947 [Escallonia herrerae]